MDSPRLILFGEDGNEEAQDEVERSDAVRLGTAGLSLAEPRRSDDWLRTLISVSSSIAIDGQLSATPFSQLHPTVSQQDRNVGYRYRHERRNNKLA